MKYKIMRLIAFVLGLYAISIVVSIVVSWDESMTRFDVFTFGFFWGMFSMAFGVQQVLKLLDEHKTKKEEK